VSTSLFVAILCSAAALSAQAPPADPFHVQWHEEFGPVNTGSTVDVLPAVTDWPALSLPNPSPAKPISGVVSLGELQHPVPEKARQAAYEAQEFARAHKTAKAIAKLEKALRIAPLYRDAHWNLGVQYARAGRAIDGRTELQKALEIGPPAASLYADLAIASTVTGEPVKAQQFAQKALEMDPQNKAAQRLLKHDPH